MISKMTKTIDTAKRGKFAATEMGDLYIDSSELRLEKGKQHMLVAIDRVTKLTYVAFFDTATKHNGAESLRQVIQSFHTRFIRC